MVLDLFDQLLTELNDNSHTVGKRSFFNRNCHIIIPTRGLTSCLPIIKIYGDAARFTSNFTLRLVLCVTTSILAQR